MIVESRTIKKAIKIFCCFSPQSVENHIRLAQNMILTLRIVARAGVVSAFVHCRAGTFCRCELLFWGATAFNQRNIQMCMGNVFRTHAGNVSSPLGCAVCPAREHNLCSKTEMERGPSAELERIFVPQSSHLAKARRRIVHEHDFHDAVPIVCGGWAASIKMLPDGRRQILAILLPGDIVSTGLLFAPRPGHVIEAITDVHYRTLNAVK